jgi:hypothetical protein
MVLLNTATKVYKGTSLATKVYRGTVQVWPPAPTSQSLYTTQIPVSDVSRSAGSFGNNMTFAVAGRITAMRYYRSSLEAGTVTSTTLTVWSSGGVSLASAATTAEANGAGWRSAVLGTPLNITAGQTVRVVKVYAVTRRDAYTAEGAFSNGHITRGDGFFKFGTGYPNTNNGAVSNFVDVSFEPT